MAVLQLTKDLSTFPIDTADLSQMWTTANLQDISAADLSPDVILPLTATTFSDFPTEPAPGQPVYHLVDNIWYIWHDEVDSTGVSLWLAAGPDRFEVPCLAFEPIPAGALVDLVYDKWVALPTEPHQRPLGANQSGINNMETMNDATQDTSDSGTWIRVAVEGIVVGVLDDAANNPSEPNLTNWQGAELIAMDTSKPWSLVGGMAPTFPPLNPIGISTRDVPQFGGTVTNPTEPAHYVPFQLQPRVYRPFGSTS